MTTSLRRRRTSSSDDPKTVRRSHDPLGDELRARALAFTDEIVGEAGAVLVKGMRGELPGSDAREQRLCAQAIRGERVPSASSLPTTAPKVVVQIASYAQISPRIADGMRTAPVLSDGSPPWQR